MKGIRRFCAGIIGVVFFIAGFLKLMDPVGAGLVVQDYFNFLHLRFLAPLSKAAGVAMALVETLLGAALITGVWRKIVGIVSGVVLAGFTILTAVLWAVGPEMDCGCFGEAVHLTHFQSFAKNVVLLLLWVVAFVHRGPELKPRKSKYAAFGVAALFVCLFAVYSLLTLPMMDFTSFKPGALLLQEDEFDPDAPALPFCDIEGNYCDQLALEGNVLAVSCYEPRVLDSGKAESVASLFEAADSIGLRPLLLVAAAPDDLAALHLPERVLLDTYLADRRTLMTLNRSRLGATLLADGTVVTKWPSRLLPSQDRLTSLTATDPTEAVIDANNPRRLRVQGFLLFVFAVMLLL